MLVTRAREQAASAVALLQARGAEAVVVPAIEIHPPRDAEAMRHALADLEERYDWVVFTSANAVTRTLDEMGRQKRRTPAFGHVKIACVGPKTADALRRRGVSVDVVALEHRQEGLIDVLLGDGECVRQMRVLLARAEVARDALPDALRNAGCLVDVVAVYRTEPAAPETLQDLVTLLERRHIDVVTFTSSSTVEHVCDALQGNASTLLARTCVASIGPSTTQTALERGIRVDVTATEFTLSGLLDAVERYLAT